MKRQNGITLIALVITIIVLLILAGTSIAMLTGENGILTQAQTAKEQTELAEQEELERLLENEYQIAKYTGEATGSYEEYVLKEKYNLEIGDYVAYDPTKDAEGNAITASYTSYSYAMASADKNEGRTSGYTENQTYSVSDVTTGWRVLGFENGKVKLISADPIAAAYNLYGEWGYRDSVEELHAICSIYGNGKGASSAKSIDEEDIYNLSGYTPVYPAGTQKFRVGTKYYYNGKNTIESSIDGGNTWYYPTNINTCRYYDNTTKQFVDLVSEKTIEISGNIYSHSFDNVFKAGQISENSKNILKDMLCKRESNQWLAKREVWSTFSTGYSVYDVCIISQWNAFGHPTSGSHMFSTKGDKSIMNAKIRPIVYLNADVEIQKDATTDGSTQAKACIIK